MLAWVAVSFSRVSSYWGIEVMTPHWYHWATREDPTFMYRIVIIWKKTVAKHTNIETEYSHLSAFFRLKNEDRNSCISIFILLISQSIYMKLHLVSHITFRNKETRSSESLNCLQPHNKAFKAVITVKLYTYINIQYILLYRKLSTKELTLQTLVLEMTVESPLNCKEIKLVNPKGNQHWIGRDWWWSWSSNILVTWFEEPTHWKRARCWERLKTKRSRG